PRRWRSTSSAPTSRTGVHALRARGHKSGPADNSSGMDRFRNCTDAELLARTAREPKAFEAFYVRHERLVLSFLIARTRNAEVAADLAAETFAGLLEAAGRFDPDRLGGTRAIPWILPLARSTLRARVRPGPAAREA